MSSSQQLTAHAVDRLLAVDDYPILVSSPVVKVVEAQACQSGEICGFAYDRVAMVADTDGEGSRARVIFPTGRHAFANGGGAPRGVETGDIIRLQKMLRLPVDVDTGVILAYDVELCAGEDDIPLVVTNYEDRINHLQTQLAEASAAIETLLKPHYAAPLLSTVRQLVVSLNSLTDQAAFGA